MPTQATLDLLADGVIAVMKQLKLGQDAKIAKLEVTNTRLEERIVQLERRLQQAAIQ